MIKKTLTTLVCLLPLISTQAGIYEPHTVWEKQKLTACFFSEESHVEITTLKSSVAAKAAYGFVPKKLSRNKKKKVIEAATREFTPGRTGIHFVGFKDCSETANPDVIVMRAGAKIFLFNDFKWGGMAVIGENGVQGIHSSLGRGYYKKIKKPAYVVLKSFSPTVIVHEFGHVAGLRHEHIHPDAQQDENCLNRRSQVNMDEPEKLEQIRNTAIIFTEYDERSVMNYCHMMLNSFEINRSSSILSRKDMATLKEIYPQ